jgi:hypothetical protein
MGKGNYKVRTESIERSTVAFGHKANAVTAVAGPQIDRESLRKALAEAEQLIELLTAHQDEVANGEALLASAVDVKEKLAKKKPGLTSIRRVLEQIAEGVAGVGVLAEIVARIQTLIGHLASCALSLEEWAGRTTMRTARCCLSVTRCQYD